MSFLAVIPHIRVQGANLQTSGILLGGVPLMASTMFAHALARKLSVKDTGVIYIHHDRQDLGGFAYGRFTPAQRRGSAFINKNDYSSKNPNALSLQPTASCHLHLSLVIRFDGRRRPRLADLQKLLMNSRFAGGQITSYGEVEWADDNEKTLKDVLGNTIKTGFVVLDRQDVLLAYQQSQNLNRLQAFTRLLALTKDGLNHAFGEHHGLSFLSATNLGYALLEDPKTDRTGVRQA
jgi:CRISPR-associated protein Csy2